MSPLSTASKARKRRFGLLTGAVVVLLAAIAGIAYAASVQVDQPYKAKFSAQFEMSPKICDNRTSEIDLSGTLTFGGIAVNVLFENQDNNTTRGKGHHTGGGSTTAELLLSNFGIKSLPKQPVNGGVGGNPWIYIQLEDTTGATVSEPILLGRCVVGQSAKSGKYDGFLDADASALIATLPCDQKTTSVDIGASGMHEGVNAKVIFTNNRKFNTHVAETDAVVSLGLADVMTWTKGGQAGGVGGNPLVSVQFTDGIGGAPVGPNHKLGRCNQLNR